MDAIDQAGCTSDRKVSRSRAAPPAALPPFISHLTGRRETMEREHVVVRNVRGRYPQHARKLLPENIEAEVTAETRIVTVRLGDANHSDFWLELTLEIGGQ